MHETSCTFKKPRVFLLNGVWLCGNKRNIRTMKKFFSSQSHKHKSKLIRQLFRAFSWYLQIFSRVHAYGDILSESFICIGPYVKQVLCFFRFQQLSTQLALSFHCKRSTYRILTYLVHCRGRQNRLCQLQPATQVGQILLTLAKLCQYTISLNTYKSEIPEGNDFQNSVVLNLFWSSLSNSLDL